MKVIFTFFYIIIIKQVEVLDKKEITSFEVSNNRPIMDDVEAITTVKRWSLAKEKSKINLYFHVFYDQNLKFSRSQNLTNGTISTIP